MATCRSRLTLPPRRTRGASLRHQTPGFVPSPSAGSCGSACSSSPSCRSSPPTRRGGSTISAVASFHWLVSGCHSSSLSTIKLGHAYSWSSHLCFVNLFVPRPGFFEWAAILDILQPPEHQEEASRPKTVTPPAPSFSCLRALAVSVCQLI